MSNTAIWGISLYCIVFSSAQAQLKVPKCEIFDPFFYTNKSYMGG
jgi:hypothetical protein